MLHREPCVITRTTPGGEGTIANGRRLTKDGRPGNPNAPLFCQSFGPSVESNGYCLPSTKSTTQHPRTCGPGPRQWPKISSLSHPASCRASANSVMSIHFHHHVIALHLGRIPLDALVGRWTQRFAGFYVELRIVPGAGGDLPGQFAFTKRPAFVRAGIVDSTKTAIHIEESNTASFGLDYLAGPCCDVLRPCDLDELWRDRSPSFVVDL